MLVAVGGLFGLGCWLVDCGWFVERSVLVGWLVVCWLVDVWLVVRWMLARRLVGCLVATLPPTLASDAQLEMEPHVVGNLRLFWCAEGTEPHPTQLSPTVCTQP